MGTAGRTRSAPAVHGRVRAVTRAAAPGVGSRTLTLEGPVLAGKHSAPPAPWGPARPEFVLVGKGGVEPPRPFGHTDLNRARLPFRHLPG